MVGLGVPRATHFNVTYPPSCALTRGSSGCRIDAGSPYCGGVTPGRDVVVRGSSDAGSKQDVPQPLSQHFDSPEQSASVTHSCSHLVLLDTLGQRPGLVTTKIRFSCWILYTRESSHLEDLSLISHERKPLNPLTHRKFISHDIFLRNFTEYKRYKVICTFNDREQDSFSDAGC